MSQKSRDLSDLNAYVEHLAQLLCIGGTQIVILSKANQKITFRAWSEAVKKTTVQPGITLDDEQLNWLWEALTTEPGILRKFGHQIRFPEDEWKDKPTVTVLNSGHVLGVFLKGLKAFGAPVLSPPGNAQAEAIITLLGPLTMGPGKAGRFECRDVKTRVEIRVQKAGSLDQEAVLMKLE